ncbi:hypothetical protein EZS27_004496 [termite gut metagenome]|jgi:hypothetical protein|uniref:Uncharacterized protein n=1 Tax=termite gut metagenome TaxID=433724 RepID=A0A5J4SPB9_9ZZZZ
MKKTKGEKEEQQGEQPQTPPKVEPLFLAQYRASYPAATRFHVTGDKMVFLNHDEACLHQKHCKGKLQTY